MIEVSLNGSSSQFEAGTTILIMLDKLELTQKRIAVEVNQEIIPRSQFAHYQLQPNDKIEIIQAIGGG